MGKVKIQIGLQIHFYDSFFIGGSNGFGNIHAYILKDIKGHPYIPASTLKGCIAQSGYEIKEFFPEVDVDYLFGKAGTQHGELYFDNGKLIENEKYTGMEGYLFDYRTGVNISRYTKAKKEGQLRTIETSGLGGEMAFSSSIYGCLYEDRYEKEVAFLVSAIRLLFAIGGNRSAGMGWFGKPIECNVQANGKLVSLNEVNKWIIGDKSTQKTRM